MGKLSRELAKGDVMQGLRRSITWAFWLLFPCAHAATHTLKEMRLQAIEQTDSAVILQLEGSARLEVRAMADDVLRVWFSPSGALKAPRSVSVLDEDGISRGLHVEDEDQVIRISTAKIELRVQKSPIRLDYYERGSGRWITGESRREGLGWRDDGTVALEHELGTSEHIYGLGEDNEGFLGHLDRRGTRRDMWTGQQIRKGRVTSDIPINFFMSTGNSAGGYGMFFDNSYHTVYDLGASDPGLWSWRADGGEALYYFIYGPSFPHILDRYTALSGRPLMPPLWALGFIQSKCCYWDWNEIDSVAREMSQRQIPFDVLVIDYNWSQVPMDFQCAQRWGSPAAVASKLSAYETQGRRFLLSTAGPMI